MFQFLIVKFDQTPERTVLANGHPVGVTNHMTLSGTGYTPAHQKITLTNTMAHRPKIVIFT